MINFRKFDAISLLDFGIVFDNPEEAEQFVSFVRKELNKRIDERVITDVTQDKLDESMIREIVKKFPYQWYNFFDFWMFPNGEQNAN